MERKVIITSDGSSTIHLPEWDEHYHSKHGAIVEAEYVFIKNGLLAENKKQFSILEVGFGTGLNALLTAQKAQQKKISINYHGIELYPVPKESYSQLNFTELIGEKKSKLLAENALNWLNLKKEDFI